MKIKTIDGVTCDESGIEKGKITVRYAKGRYGETLSLENGKVQLSVDFAEIRELVGIKK